MGSNDLICDNCGNEDQSDFAPGEDGKPACGNCGWQLIRTRREVEEQDRIKADLARVEPEGW